MNKDVVKRYIGKEVKLVQTDNFVLYGTIDEVFDDCIVFRTDTKSSAIALDYIMAII